ncbi:MAG: M20/M25/M40 family metallo-hydrolase [Verrucomicrobiota bacterium]
MQTDTLPARYRQNLINDLCRLVQIPSRSSLTGGEEGPIQALVLQRMREEGARVHSFEADDVPGFKTHRLCHGPERNYRARPTVIGEIGPENAPALMVLAHSDTVQINRPREWTFDPFVGNVCDGMIRGLGAGDDKWGIATLLTILRALQDSGRPLRKRLTLISTIDEEHGIGNGTLLLMLAGLKAEAALYLDGCAMQVCIGNLGGSVLELHPRISLSTDQAACDARRLRAACQEESRRRMALFDRDLYRLNLARDHSLAFYAREDAKGVYYIIGFCTLPEESKEIYRKKMEMLVVAALGPEADHYTVGFWEPWFDATLIPATTPLIGYMTSAITDILKCEPTITTISLQDNFVLNKYAGIPTVSFGPQHLTGRGFYHQPDEYISIADAWKGARVVYAAVCRWLDAK